MNKKLNICFFTRNVNLRFLAYSGCQFEKIGSNVSYITDTPDDAKNLKTAQCTGHEYNLVQYIELNWHNKQVLDSVDLTSIEEEYKIESLWRILYTDRFLIYAKYNDVIKFMKLHIRFFLEILEKEQFNYFIYENISHFSAYIFFLLCKGNGITYIGFSGARNYADTKCFFTNDENQTNYILNSYYFGDMKITNRMLNEASHFINDYKKTKKRPEYMEVYGKKPSIDVQMIKGLIKYPIYLLRKEKIFNYTGYYDQDGSPLRKMKQYFKYLYQKKFFQASQKGDQFYLFGLHFQPEATTLVNAANYEKQLYAIDLIAKSIPVNSILYVKEHYTDLGHRETYFYKKIKSYPNVRIINPWENSRLLIEKSLGVITLAGTMGWEAILLNKPVFLLGKMFYSSFKYTNNIHDINDLSYILKNHKMLGVEKNIYDDELKKYIASYLVSLKDGSYITYGNSIGMDNGNKEALFDSLLNEITRLESLNS